MLNVLNLYLHLHHLSQVLIGTYWTESSPNHSHPLFSMHWNYFMENMWVWITEKNWRGHWKLHLLCRRDNDPCKDQADANNLIFGLSDEKIKNYVELSDLFHGLILYRYGATGLYVTKRVDLESPLLKQLPFHSLFRCSTEGGAQAHYLHQCLLWRFLKRWWSCTA